MTPDMPTELREKLEKQGYHLLGERGGYKACQWQKKSLLHGDTCYKEKFYGIESHRCLQMTPVVDKCTQNCEFCWRVTPQDVNVSWNQTTVRPDEVLPPVELLDQTMMANLRSLGGYNPEAGAKVSQEKYLEARKPKHVAISLAGEPTLYPFLSEFIEEIHRREMTSFLVSNGTTPDTLAELTLPTQLYITLAAPDKETHTRLLRPGIPDAWERLMESQELLNSLDCRTVNRLTMVAGHNMHDIRAYANQILIGEPDFVEVKGYMHLGSSRERLGKSNAPAHREIRAFSEKLAALTGYYLVDEQIESRVVLLSRIKHIKRLT
ncbi:MAG: 4-demethylwyosine synthase TYW1 [Candidatus Thorarchaeota archaeon]|nr:4-demethylwyosine synthase TYW1 [Candidatus Thorarchaeota archaeon]